MNLFYVQHAERNHIRLVSLLFCSLGAEDQTLRPEFCGCDRKTAAGCSADVCADNAKCSYHLASGVSNA